MADSKESELGSIYYRKPGGLLSRVTDWYLAVKFRMAKMAALSRINSVINDYSREEDGSDHSAVWHEELDIVEISEQTFISTSPLFQAASTNDVDRLEAAFHLRVGASTGEAMDADKAEFFGQRTPSGATALHTAVLYNSHEVMMKLIEYYPDIVNLVHDGGSDVYKGQHALHLAIANNNFRMVKELVKHNAKLDNTVRATGSFFRPDSNMQTVYWGESVVTFAACTNQFEVVKFLVEKGADITVQDAELNNVIHLLCQSAGTKEAGLVKAGMITKLLNLAKPREQHILLETKNRYGWTPMQMAAYQGATESFRVLVELRRRVHWTYGPVRSSVYSLKGLDTHMDDQSALSLIVHSPSKERVKLVQMTPVRQLLAEKWRDFAHYCFIMWAIAYLIHLTVLVLVVWYRPMKLSTCYKAEGNSTELLAYSCRPYISRGTYSDAYTSIGDYFRLIGELFVIIWALCILKLEVVDFWKQHVRGSLSSTFLGGYSTLALIYAVNVIVAAIMRLGDCAGQEVPMAIAVLAGFSYLLNFARAIPVYGPYVVMISNMLTGDVLLFLVMLCVFVPPFSIARVLTQQGATTPAMPYLHDNFFKSLLDFFHIAVGNTSINIPDVLKSPFPVLEALVTGLFLVLATVLLLNLLIAMMSFTFQDVKDHQFDVWTYQMASLVLFIERRVPSRFKIRSGFPGSSLGLRKDPKWYLRVQDNDVHSGMPHDEEGMPATPVPAAGELGRPSVSETSGRRIRFTREASVLTMMSDGSDVPGSTYQPASPGLVHTHGSGRMEDERGRPIFFSFTPEGAAHLAPGGTLPRTTRPRHTSTVGRASTSTGVSTGGALDRETSSLAPLHVATSNTTLDDSDYEEPYTSRDTLIEDLHDHDETDVDDHTAHDARNDDRSDHHETDIDVPRGTGDDAHEDHHHDHEVTDTAAGTVDLDYERHREHAV